VTSLFIFSMASPVLQSFCCANSSFLLYGNTSEVVRLSADDAAFLWYNVICVVSSTSGVVGCLCQLIKRTPRCIGCLKTPDNALLLLVQNNIIGCLATADLLAVLGTETKLVILLGMSLLFNFLNICSQVDLFAVLVLQQNL